MWYGFLLTLGVVLLGISIFLIRDRVRFLKAGTVTTGVVIEMKEENDSDGGLTYRPVFKFKTTTNEEVIIEYSLSSKPPEWSVGDEARLVYHNQYPHKAIVLTYWGSFLYIIILMAFALPLIVIGGGYYLAEYFFRSIN